LGRSATGEKKYIDMLHLLTAIGLSPGGSTHLHTIYRIAQIMTNTQITTNVEVVICVLFEAFACNVKYIFIAFMSVKCPLVSAWPVSIIYRAIFCQHFRFILVDVNPL
jgi:hypothetical protein